MERKELCLIDIFITRLQGLSIVDEVWLDTTGYYHPLIEKECIFDDPKINYKDPTLNIVLREGIDEEQEKIYKELLKEILIQFKNGSEEKYTKLNCIIMNSKERDKLVKFIFNKYEINLEDYQIFSKI